MRAGWWLRMEGIRRVESVGGGTRRVNEEF